MKRTRWYLPWTLLAGVVLLVASTEAARGTAVVLNKLKAKQDSSTSTTTTENPKPSEDDEGGSSVEVSSEADNTTTKSLLTGIPQQDYVHDPNLPRELNGYNLTDYPFFDRVPEVLHFDCKGRLDGFYADVTYQCQVYHHCLYGTRHDFLCANYTAFDQRTFICHFASEVDCKNSHKYWSRNEPLYKATTTTTQKTTTVATTTTVAPPPAHRRPAPGRRRRPYRRRRPVYEYYYDDEEYEDDQEYYYDDPTGPAEPLRNNQRRRKRPRPSAQRPLTGPGLEDEERAPAADPPATDLVKPRVGAGSVYDRPRAPPKVRRPVPVNEREKYNYSNNRPASGGADAVTPQATHARPSKTTPRPQSDDSEYYDDEEDYEPPARNTRPGKTQDYYAPTATGDRRQPPTGAGRPLRRNQRPTTNVRRRPGEDTRPQPEEDEYEDSYEDEQPRRPARPTQNNRKHVQTSARDQQDYHRPRQEAEYSPQRTSYSSQRGSAGSRYEQHSDQPVPAPRPAYISTTPRQSYASRKRPQQPELPPSGPDYGTSGQRSTIVNDYKRPAVASRKPPVQPPTYDELGEDEEYYDDEEEDLSEEEPVYNSRPKQSNRQRPEDARQPVTTSKRPFLYTNRVTTPRGTSKHQGSRVQVSAPGGEFLDDRDFRNTQEERPLRTSADLLDDFKLKTSRPIADVLEVRPLRTPPDDSLEEHTVRRPDNVETRPPRPAQEYTVHRHRDAAPAPEVPQRSGYPHSLPPSSVNHRSTEEKLPSAPGANYRRNPSGDPPSGPAPRNKSPSAYDSTAPRGNAGKYRADHDILTHDESLEDEEETPSKTVQGTIESPPSRGSVTFKPPHLTTANPGSLRIPENIPIKQNLADISEDEEDYDESLNEALHPRIIPTGNGFVYVPASSPSSPQKPRIKVFKNKVGQQNYQSRYTLGPVSFNPLSTTTRSNVVGSSPTGQGNLATSASQRHVTRTPYRYKQADYVGATGKDLDLSEDYGAGEDVPYGRDRGRQGSSTRQQHRRIQPTSRDYASY